MDLKKTYGLSGTDIYSGYIDEDYNPIWRGQTKIDLVEEMKKSDGTIAAISDAMKAPLLNANWYIETGSKDEQDHEIAEWVEKVFIHDMNFKAFLEESLLFIDYGFYLHEKIFEVRDGMVCLKEFAPRVPKSIEKWAIGKQLWKNGHPSGVTQYLNYTDEVQGEEQGKLVSAEIPWEKLLVLTHRKTGKNYEGESIFRRCYSHWIIKQKLYKISAVAAERFGSGTPYFKLKQGTSPDVMNNYEKIAKNIRSNELAGLAITEDVVEWGIMVPQGTNSIAQMLDEMIKHHDKKMYDSVLAGFLNLTGGDKGSNALSQDQSSFFILSVNYNAKIFTAEMNKVIKELVIMNYGKREYYPTLEYGELDEKNIKEITDGLAVAVNAGMIQWGDLDEQRMREMYDLADKDDVVIEGEKSPIDDGDSIEPKEETGLEEEKQADVEPKEPEEMSLSNTPKMPSYERVFTKAISDYENYLASEYANFDAMASEAEERYKAVLLKAIDKAEKERKDGVEILSVTKGNERLMKETQKEVDAITKRLQKKWIDSPMQERLFKKTVQSAVSAYDTFSLKLSVDPIKLRGMVRGYISNIEAVLMNDPRRVKEQVDLLLTTGAVVATSIIAVNEMQVFNRNTLKLSVQAHARAEFNSIVYDEAVAGGFTFFKVLVPKQKMKDVKPDGMTAGILFTILTALGINEYANRQTEGKNASAVQGLGLHHNSYEYYMPVPSDDLKDQEELSTFQRSQIAPIVENK